MSLLSQWGWRAMNISNTLYRKDPSEIGELGIASKELEEESTRAIQGSVTADCPPQLSR